MMDKVKAIRSQIDSRYVDDEHRRFCKSSGDETFSRVPEFKTGVVSLEFPRLDGPSYIRSAMALAYPIKWTPRKLEIDTFSHSLLDPVFQAMPGYVKGDMSDLIDMEWYNACLSYLRTLGRLDFIIVMDYTYNGASFTNGNGAMNLQRQREIDIEDEKDGYVKPLSNSTRRGICIKVIHVLPGTPALCLWPIGGHEDQKEIVLPPGTNYLIKSHRLRNIVVEVPTFTQGKAVRGEVCWDEMVKRKARNPKFEKMFPRKWVTEIYVDGTAAAIRSRSTRDPQTWRSNASKALKNVPWETLGSTPVSDGNALGLFLANCNVAVKTGVWTPVSRQIRSMKSSGVIGLDAESSLLTFVDTWFKPVGQPGLSAREQMRSLVEKISSIVPLPSHK
eukprot:jgi/Mesvir1/6591/Mv08884-RA.1